MMCRLRGYHPLLRDFPDSSPASLKAGLINSLAATFGISVDFSSSGYLDVSVPGLPPVAMYSQQDTCNARGFPHSEIPDSKGYYPNLGLSQVITSFIASDCQGIHRVRLVT